VTASRAPQLAGQSLESLAPDDSGELRRALRRASQVVPLGWSAGGRRFGFQAPLTLSLPAGGYALLTAPDDERYLGQVLERAVTELDSSRGRFQRLP
jgi:hypothetical protein